MTKTKTLRFLLLSLALCMVVGTATAASTPNSEIAEPCGYFPLEVGCPGGCSSLFQGNQGVEGIFCSVVPPGFYSEENYTGYKVCDFGHYNPEFRRATPCDPCPIGTYSSTFAATSCDSCPPGRYQDETGQTSCKACDDTYYKGEGANSIVQDPWGTYFCGLLTERPSSSPSSFPSIQPSSSPSLLPSGFPSSRPSASQDKDDDGSNESDNDRWDTAYIVAVTFITSLFVFSSVTLCFSRRPVYNKDKSNKKNKSEEDFSVTGESTGATGDDISFSSSRPHRVNDLFQHNHNRFYNDKSIYRSSRDFVDPEAPVVHGEIHWLDDWDRSNRSGGTEEDQQLADNEEESIIFEENVEEDPMEFQDHQDEEAVPQPRPRFLSPIDHRHVPFAPADELEPGRTVPVVTPWEEQKVPDESFVSSQGDSPYAFYDDVVLREDPSSSFVLHDSEVEEADVEEENFPNDDDGETQPEEGEFYEGDSFYSEDDDYSQNHHDLSTRAMMSPSSIARRQHEDNNGEDEANEAQCDEEEGFSPSYAFSPMSGTSQFSN